MSPTPAELRAWLYDVDQDGISRAMWPTGGQHGLQRDQSLENWARNRHDVLAGPDGLFKAADWYPSLGGRGRTLVNHLAAFHRLVELGTIKFYRVQRWANEHDVRPYVIIDPQLGRRG
jgi:hypothetical protein